MGVSGQASATFGRDGRNREVKRTINGTTTYLIYDGWNLVAEYDASGTLTTRYIHGPRLDESLAKVTTTGSTYPLEDALGSTIAVTDHSGTVLERITYTDAYGTPAFQDASGNALSGTITGTRFLFTGREWIAPLGLYDYRNRTYSPALGRFIQADPIRFEAGDVNLYRYVANDPANWADPKGLSIWGWRNAWDYYNQLKNPNDGSFDGPGGDKLAHCMAHCEIVKQQPLGLGYLDSYFLDYGKEALDGIRGIWDKKSRWDKEDQKANQQGRDCAGDSRGCECCCKDKYG